MKVLVLLCVAVVFISFVHGAVHSRHAKGKAGKIGRDDEHNSEGDTFPIHGGIEEGNEEAESDENFPDIPGVIGSPQHGKPFKERTNRSHRN